MIRYGFACKIIGVPGAVQTTATLAKADAQNLLRISRHNLHALALMLRYCRDRGLALMRISSDIIPLASHPDVRFDWQTQLGEEFAHLRAVLRDSGVRVSMHPGQYTILNSPRDEVAARAIDDLSFHADFLDALGADQTARIVLHLGGGYGDKHAALKRLQDKLRELPQTIRRRLALENDERIYTIEDVLEICGQFSLPALFDVFHHALHAPSHGTMLDWLDRSALTWSAESGRQKIHYSQQLPGGKPGMHSQTISRAAFLAFHHELGRRELDVMLEVKDKNLSAVKCANLTALNLARQNLTEEWARYKYLVLEHDPLAYAAIREILKTDAPDANAFYACLEQALAKEVTPGHARNAAQHIWGYLDKLASSAESKRIHADIAALDKGTNALPRLKRKLFALAEKHGKDYLLRSLYFYV